MPTPLEDHGGIIPSSSHPIVLPDVPNTVVVLVKSSTPNISMEFYSSLQLNRVSKIFYLLSEAPSFVPAVHPIIEYCMIESSIESFMQSYCTSVGASQQFFYVLENPSVVPSALWSVLATANPNVSFTFQTASGEHHTLVSVSPSGIAPSMLVSQPTRSLSEVLGSSLCEMELTVSDSYTPLCQLATAHMTDKTPYGIVFHRHPYTPMYDMLLRPFQLQPSLVFGEVGVLNGASIHMWRSYFPNASIHAFDISIESLIKVKDISGVTTHLVDKNTIHSIVPCLAEATSKGALFDVLLEDASHMLDHQLHFLKDAIQFVRPGGLLIIEDIFRAIPSTRFQEALDCVRTKVHNAVLFKPEHTYRHSPGWENDRVLVVWVK